MSKHNLLQVTSHLTTSNIYVRKEIVLNNLNSINNTLNNRAGLNISNALYWDIVNLNKNQKKILNSLNLEIQRLEQSSFPFGGMLS